MEKVIIASKNPVKINSVKLGFEKMFPGKEFEFESVSTPSDVSNQPMNSKETLLGAENRARKAKELTGNADYWVGIEGGVEKTEDEMETFAWIVIKSRGLSGKSRTGTFFLPEKVVELINSGKELGEADDIIFGHKNSKQQMGSVGILTENVIDRVKYYTEAVILSLIPFKNSEIY